MEAKGRRWTRCIAAIAGLLTLFATAGIAVARLTTESGSTTIAPQENGAADARCPAGSAAVAGGFAAPGFDPTTETGPAILTFATERSGDRHWEASGHNFNAPASAKVAPGSGSLISYAYCDKHEPSVKVRSKSTTVDGGTHASLTPKCPRGSEAVSGGFVSEAPTAANEGLTDYAYTSKRAGKQAWKTAVLNPNQSPHKVRAFAYCEKHAPDLSSESASKKVTTTSTITAKCPRGSKAFSGGYKSTFDQSGGGRATSIAFTSKRKAGRRWKVSAISVALNHVSPIKETAIAYCAT